MFPCNHVRLCNCSIIGVASALARTFSTSAGTARMYHTEQGVWRRSSMNPPYLVVIVSVIVSVNLPFELKSCIVGGDFLWWELQLSD